MIVALFVFLPSAKAQLVITCPEGDFYKCYTEKTSEGGVITVYKGTGDTTVKKPIK